MAKIKHLLGGLEVYHSLISHALTRSVYQMSARPYPVTALPEPDPARDRSAARR